MKKIVEFLKQHIAMCITACLAIALIIAVAAVFAPKGRRGAKPGLVVVSPHPKAFIIPLIKEFENETGIKTEVISLGTSAALKRITEDKDVDVLWGGSLLSVSTFEDAFYAYTTPNREAFDKNYESVDRRITCFTLVPSVIMINTDLIGDIEVKGYKALLDPKLKGRIAFADPGSSSSSFEHLVNMLYAMGEGDPEKGFGYVEAFCKNLDGVLLSSSSEVYEGVANGKYTVGLTFEEAAVTMLNSGKHISIVYMEEGVVFTPDGICISRLSERKPEAEAFVDFMTSNNAQGFITANLGRRSVRTDITESGIVAPYESIKRIEVPKDSVIAGKEDWIARFGRLFKAR